MRTDLIKDLSPMFGPKHTAVLVLMSDYELMLNKYGITMGVRERTLKELKTFHSGITQTTMWKLVQEDVAQPQGRGWILKIER